MPPKRFEGKFGIPASHPVDSLLTQALYRLPESMSLEHIEGLANDIVSKVNIAREHERGGEPLTQEETHTLHLKLARHYEDNGESAEIDVSSCVDALVESPRFLKSDKGSMEKLFELHEMKTLQKIAELRRKRAEIAGGEEVGLNPYENLFETHDGEYYLARLLNMPHLEEESEYMKHCVGTSDSYVNKMKRGEVEILSFRHVPTINSETKRLEETPPIMTIEYNLKTKTIEQMKKYDDAYLNRNDPYFNDVIDALKQLRTSRTDTGELRDFSKIATSELRNIDVRDEYLLTSSGEVNFRDFDPNGGDFVLKIGKLEIHPDTPKDDAARMLQIVDNIDCTPDQIAYNSSEIRNNSKVYIGKLDPGIFEALPKELERVYTKFPEERIKFRSIELNTGITDGPAFQKAIEKQGMRVGGYAADMLKNQDFKVVGEDTHAELIEISVSALGFQKNTKYGDICARAKELGLELCPAEVGPQLRLQYTDQPSGKYLIVAMKAINDSDGGPSVFGVSRLDDGLWLHSYDGRPGHEWDPENRFLFLRPRKN